MGTPLGAWGCGDAARNLELQKTNLELGDASFELPGVHVPPSKLTPLDMGPGL